ncbi:THO complex subunit 5 [Xenoophorus captivus]|uniref:THO complex subunit 5 n=1 Tax=Xenoophorus captivus TaxID=1517983 RepID=A0ABV0RFQ1_9TELE
MSNIEAVVELVKDQLFPKESGFSKDNIDCGDKVLLREWAVCGGNSSLCHDIHFRPHRPALPNIQFIFCHIGNWHPLSCCRSKHEEIDLVSEEEFYQDAPQEISRPNLTKNDPHQLTLARLDWELEQRKRLAEKYKESQSTKEKIQKSIEVKKEHLRSLQPGLNAIMQDYLSMPFEKTQKQAEIARHLPPPLYVLFVQANAYGQACGEPQ